MVRNIRWMFYSRCSSSIDLEIHGAKPSSEAATKSLSCRQIWLRCKVRRFLVAHMNSTCCLRSLKSFGFVFVCRCRGWYDTGRSLSIEKNVSLHITAPYVFAFSGLNGQSGTMPLVDPSTGQHVGQTLYVSLVPCGAAVNCCDFSSNFHVHLHPRRIFSPIRFFKPWKTLHFPRAGSHY